MTASISSYSLSLTISMLGSRDKEIIVNDLPILEVSGLDAPDAEPQLVLAG